jgi:hypothetical protein
MPIFPANGLRVCEAVHTFKKISNRLWRIARSTPPRIGDRSGDRAPARFDAPARPSTCAFNDTRCSSLGELRSVILKAQRLAHDDAEQRAAAHFGPRCTTLLSTGFAPLQPLPTRTKSRLLAVGGQNPARRGLSAGAEWIRTFSSALDRQQFVVSSELGPIYRRTVIRAVVGLGDRVVGRGPGRRHSPPGSGGVTPRSRCRRCERIAEAKVRIRPPPAASPLRTDISRGRSRTLASRCLKKRARVVSRDMHAERNRYCIGGKPCRWHEISVITLAYPRPRSLASRLL